MQILQQLINEINALPVNLELDIKTEIEAELFEQNYPNLLAQLGKISLLAQDLNPDSHSLDVLQLVEDALGAYPPSVFKPVSKGERDRLKRRYPGLQERLAAEMGRHMGEVVLIPVRAELLRLLSNQKPEEVPIV